MQSLTVNFLSVISDTAIGRSVVISQEHFKRVLCLPGWLSRNIIRGPILSENDRHLCMWDERIRRDSCQNILTKTLHSDTKREHYVVFSSPVSMVYAWNAWDHDLPFGDKERSCILWHRFCYGSPSKQCKNSRFPRIEIPNEQKLKFKKTNNQPTKSLS